jgi:hypothetical protein
MSDYKHSESAPPLQKHSSVQHLLGRCLLKLQEYESLLKRMLPNTAVSAPPHDVLSSIAKKRASLQKKMMGELVGTLTGSFLMPEGSDQHKCSLKEDASKAIWIESRTQVIVEAERFVEIKASLKELVTLRNELVHHFIDKFDLNSDEGCAEAESFLECSYRTIDEQFTLLSGWSRAMVKAQTKMASLLSEPLFLNFIDGISPNGTVDWPRAGIVQGLRDAEEHLAVNGWTELNAAIAWVSENSPEQTPQRFNCDSWLQVMHESHQFELRWQSFDRLLLNAQPERALSVWFRSHRQALER